ncbi:hypothetical protein GGX14DRAFT_527663 [Mycena pura]|uniref:Uncharacterized protein n=1 Tax=Mycena pura TaxID=153505 RepID=A0AAD6UZY0_9AGAR|nr:hypothetical protein GGX14DRAFT_527663 [Mycena pura]
MSKPANELYRLLVSQKHGFPLFTPEPNENLPIEYRKVGVSIGDVGILGDGSFEVLFNACRPTSHSINGVHGVPEDFTVFPLSNRQISRRSYHSPGSIITSAKISEMSLSVGGSSAVTPFSPVTVGSSVTFRLQSKAAAILVLPDGASREKLLPVETFRAYVRKYSRQWYTYARDYLPPTGSLFVVTGCDKTTSWGIATASAITAAVGFSLKFAVIGVAEGTLAPQFQWQEFGSATVRTSCSNSRAENQCIFIRGFVVPKGISVLTSVFNKILLRGLRADKSRRCSLQGYQIDAVEENVTKKTMVSTEAELHTEEPLQDDAELVSTSQTRDRDIVG